METPQVRETLRELKNRNPFVPFRMVLIGGKEYEIKHAQLLAMGETQITVYAPKSDDWSFSA